MKMENSSPRRRRWDEDERYLWTVMELTCGLEEESRLSKRAAANGQLRTGTADDNRSFLEQSVLSARKCGACSAGRSWQRDPKLAVAAVGAEAIDAPN